MKNTHLLLESFADYATLCGGDNYTTVVPILTELHIHLEKIKEKHGMVSVSVKFSNQLKW